MKSKGQVGTEYLIISGFLLFAALIFFAYSITSYNDLASQSKARNVVDSLANTASQLSGMGNNSSLAVNLDFPEGISSFQVSGRTVRLFLNNGNGLLEYYADASIDLNSIALDKNSGPHIVKAGVKDNKVNFTDA